MANFILGELVTLKYHPYLKDKQQIYIMADATMTPPVMVVTEILYSKTEVDITLENVEPEQIKCEFYSHKSHKFESNWFLPSQVKRLDNSAVKTSSTKEMEAYILSGKLENINIILKTWKIELGKKKISLSETISGKDNKIITSNLNFLPPVMTILKLEKNTAVSTSKKPIKQNRIVPPYLIKCKWFNPKSDSFSEGSFTPESLDFLSNNEEVVDLIYDNIRDHKFLKFNNPNISYNKGNTIGKPLRISYNHCYYELEYFDYLTNKTYVINLNDFSKSSFKIISNPILKFAPAFSEVHIGLTPIEFIENHILAASTAVLKNFFKIKYVDRNDIHTTRTITNCKFFYNGNLVDVGTANENKMERYLKADCLMRNGEERYFKFQNIQSIELLDI